MAESSHGYALVVGREIVAESQSALHMLAVYYQHMSAAPQLIIRYGGTLRSWSLHELEWDASAERAGESPTYYWPKPGERGPTLRAVSSSSREPTATG